MRDSAFSPRMVTLVEMRSLRLMPNVRTVYLAFPKTGCCPVSCSKTCRRSSVGNGRKAVSLSFHHVVCGNPLRWRWQIAIQCASSAAPRGQKNTPRPVLASKTQNDSCLNNQTSMMRKIVGSDPRHEAWGVVNLLILNRMLIHHSAHPWVHLRLSFHSDWQGKRSPPATQHQNPLTCTPCPKRPTLHNLGEDQSRILLSYCRHNLEFPTLPSWAHKTVIDLCLCPVPFSACHRTP